MPITLLVVGIAAVALVAGLALMTVRRAEPLAPVAATAPEDTGSCRTTPAFTADPQIVGPAFSSGGSIAFATDRSEKGLVLLSAAGASPFQGPSWDDAGFLGPIAYDDQGNIYAAPSPRLSLQDNPLVGQPTLWRVDAATGVMRPFTTLPGAASERNPYGVMGLTFDCAHRRLYAGSVLGSLPTRELGGVVGIEQQTGEQMPILTDFDAMGVLVVKLGAGYELYAASARRSEIVAIDLDAAGNAVGEPRLLIDLSVAGATPSERARKLRLVDGRLVVDLVPFNFSLQSSASDVPQLRRATWTYDVVTGAWVVEQQAASVAL